MKEKNILDKIKDALGIEIKLEQLPLDNGTIVEAELFEPNAEIFIISEEERIPLPIGDYILEDGRMIAVKQDGIIFEIKEKDMKPEAEAAPEVEQVAAEEIPVKKVIESISKETHFNKEYLEVELQKLRDEFNEKLEALKPKTELVEEKVEPLKHSPEAEVETRKRNSFAKNRIMSTEDLVFEKMFKDN